MDRCAVFVDAGHLFAQGGKLCCGTERRKEFTCDYIRFTAALAEHASKHCGLPILRTYWYDAALHAVPEPEQVRVAELPNVKLRLGRLVGGRQKGVDSLIVRDIMTLARERAIATAYLLGGDEDLREGVIAAQEMGVRVVILGIPTTDQGNQAETLTREADEHVVLPTAFWSPFFSKVQVGTPAAEAQPVEVAGELPQPAPAEAAELRGAVVRRIGEQFAVAWAKLVVPDEVRELVEQAPRIPRELDFQLILEAEKTLGSLR